MDNVVSGSFRAPFQSVNEEVSSGDKRILGTASALTAIRNYLNQPPALRRSKFNPNFHHRHGETGIKRAQLLEKYLMQNTPSPRSSQGSSGDRRGAISLEREEFNELLDRQALLLETYKKGKVSPALLAVIDGSGLVTDKHIKDAKLLNGGNSHTSSLRRYVMNSEVTEEAPPITNKPIGEEIAEDSYLIDRSQLKNTGGDVSQSAHAVTRYKKDDTYYFGKNFPSADSVSPEELAETKEKALAEVCYSMLWQSFIGDRASSSMFMKNENGEIDGICSKGLPGFREYKSCLEDGDAAATPGMLPILVTAFLLEEDDLHSKNIGKCEIDGRQVYGKIDHDYIADKYGTDQQPNFPIERLAEFLNSPTPQTADDMGREMRFSPITKNSRLLRMGHAIRNFFNIGPDTTLGKHHRNEFYSRSLTRFRHEAQDISSKIKNYDVGQIDRLIEFAEKQRESMGIEDTDSIAVPILKRMKARIEYLQENLE
ncbi:hypothetical protein M9194_14825 [Vibrio sp. S4M6]|uniref:hypothetical protein n=1 Tax=Vibrio sinus TaxID=2946865 RepID=UPI002029B7AC|nr:hypothetical protein [Vibrio sinus]MCL9782707.1 hypothetical protein [Vibrio sinus]